MCDGEDETNIGGGGFVRAKLKINKKTHEYEPNTNENWHMQVQQQNAFISLGGVWTTSSSEKALIPAQFSSRTRNRTVSSDRKF